MEIVSLPELFEFFVGRRYKPEIGDIIIGRVIEVKDDYLLIFLARC